MSQWFKDVWEGFWTVLVGMRITWRHMFTQPATLQYPSVKWPLPPKSRMRLFMHYEDCIGCGQCARACPVNCISIKTEKRDKELPPAFAATGNPIKLNVTVFDIDMSLCCYCNLCTYPCPTECLYMTTDYEFASSDLTQHFYRFAKKDAKFLSEKPAKKDEPAKPATAPPVAPVAPPAKPSEA